MNEGVSYILCEVCQRPLSARARGVAGVAARENFARLRRAYRNRGPADRPPDFLYRVRNSVQNRLRISYMRFLRLCLLLYRLLTAHIQLYRRQSKVLRVLCDGRSDGMDPG